MTKKIKHYNIGPVDHFFGLISLDELEEKYGTENRELLDEIREVCNDLKSEIGPVRNGPFIQVMPKPLEEPDIFMILFKEEENGDTHIFTKTELPQFRHMKATFDIEDEWDLPWHGDQYPTSI